MQDLRREIHIETTALGAAARKMSSLQEAGAQDHFGLHHAAQAQAAVRDGREKGGFSGL